MTMARYSISRKSLEKIHREDNLDTVSSYEKILIGYLTSRIRVRQIICRVVYGRIHEACV